MNITTSKAEFASYPTNEWIVNFENGFNQEPDSNLQAIAQDVRFALETERYKYPIMGANFGVTFEDLIGTDYNYIRSEVARRIQDALSIDDRVIGANSFQFERLNDGGMLIKCVVSTVLGDIPIETTIIV